ncbi:MAG: hypothetical protein SGBAC_010779 [Bacillariaceae sp.]
MRINFLLFTSLLANAASFQVQQPIHSSTRSFSPSPLSAYLNIDEQAERDVGAMDEWATMCEVQRGDGFQLTTEDGMDYSAMTTADIAEGSPILCIPGNMIISTSSVRAELGGQEAAVDFLTRNGSGDQVGKFFVFLKMMAEYEQGDQSPYFPWLNSLPRLFFNAISMTDFCYECLPPLVFQLARKEKVKFDNYFDALQKADCISDQTKTNKAAARWAYNIVTTRSQGSDDEKFIAPMADMFNHETETEVDFSFDDEGNLYAYATRNIPAGSPLRMSYGCPTNPSELFAKYGFLDETSPATFCKIMTITPTQQLYEIGYGFDKMLFYKDSGEVSEEVWDVLLYQELAKNRDVQQAFYNAHMQGDAATKAAIHEQYSLETCTALKNHVDSFLQQLEDLSSKSFGKDYDEHPRLPLILRHNEFVKETFLKVKANLDPMVAQAQGGVYA